MAARTSFSFAPPSRVLRPAPDQDLEAGHEAVEALVPRSPRREKLLKEQLPAAERRSEAQLTTCDLLLRAATRASEALNAAGNGLQREASVALQQLLAAFASEGGSEETSSKEAQACSRCLLLAWQELGAMLLNLAAALTGDVLTPLSELRRGAEASAAAQRAELEKLECSETLCSDALQESVLRKDKVSVELQERASDFQAKPRSRRGRAVRWLLKAGAKADSKLQHAAHVQTAAVEELAQRVDQLLAAQQQRDERAEVMLELLSAVAPSRKALLVRALRRCAGAWGEGAESLTAAVGRFQEVADSAVDRQVEAESPEAAPTRDSEAEASPKDADPPRDSREARAKVPPLRLSTLPAFDDQGSLVNTDSASSSCQRVTSDSEGMESRLSRLSSKGSAACNSKGQGAEAAPAAAPSSLGDLVAALQRDVSFDDADSFVAPARNPGQPKSNTLEAPNKTYPSNSRFNLFSVTCNDVDTENCNIFDPKYLQRFHEINEKILNITIDGDEIVADLDEQHKRSEGDNRPWTQYAGDWTFNGRPENVNGSVVFQGRKCFAFGPFCGRQSILDVFRSDDHIISTLTADNVKLAVNEWEDQENFCPLTIANANSPCFDTNCQRYDTTAERNACRVLARTYCDQECPTRTFLSSTGEEVTVAISMANCHDRGCITLGSFESANNSNTQLNTDPNATGEAPESAFEFQPTKIRTMVGGLQLDANQKYTGGKYLSGFFALNKAELYCPTAGVSDPVADEWERRALCFMGVNADTRAEPKLDCPEDDLLKFSGLFQRSLGDEFGNAIRGDISKLTASYGVIIVYCAIMIGKCDAIHSGMFLSFVAVLIVGLTIASTLGLMGYFGVPNGNLNNNLYFLLLGLGVDDAFVLSSEFLRHSREDSGKSIPDRIAATARTGGISVLITSATDALAFLVGATTVLPALGWFCTYAGVSIVLCYTYQLTVFLPCLALNARRIESNRIDCCCCCRVPERSIEDPQGCCLGCCLPKGAFKGGQLSKGLKAFMTRVTTPVGQAVTFILFAALTGIGIYGSTMIYKDFKLEWFIPDSSYVNEFFNINSEYFATGTPITVNMRETPATFEAQSNMRELHNYLTTSELVNQDVAVDSWYEEFMEWAVDPSQAVTASAVFTPSRTDPDATFQDSSAFYTALYTWYRGTTGSRYRGSMIWASSA
ncbi:Patched domain-containing protein 3 [Symbiodinium microadriaticum]|uniref:Patched domain-containing protein 3 n=1 Tax=Symbiodinium microadriaticum TaxID=2951 RepID=A0A1Q9EGB3_SYMMI|nr:Patched domain-containing protein 3 [Symbiodinium microadriaticum]